MKTITTIISFFFITLSFAQNNETKKAFAIIKGEKFLIIGDTLKLKSTMLQLVMDDNSGKVKLSVQVVKSQTIGEAVKNYYYVLLQDKEKNVMIAKWLEKENDELFMLNDFNGENYWQVLTTACIGTGDCTPQVAIIDSKMNWVCGHALVCKIDSTCKKVSAILD